MSNMVNKPLAMAFPPGVVIREELEERGWTQQQLADRMGRPLQIVNMIVNGHKAITAETALQLEQAFGVQASFWLNFENEWQLYKVRQKKKESKRSKQVTPARSRTGSPRLR